MDINSHVQILIYEINVYNNFWDIGYVERLSVDFLITLCKNKNLIGNKERRETNIYVVSTAVSFKKMLFFKTLFFRIFLFFFNQQ